MKRLFVCVIAMLLLLPQGVTGRASAGDVDVNGYLALVRRSNEDIRASLRLVEAKYFSVRSALATQRPAAGLKGNASRVTGDTGGDYTLSVAVTHRFDISGIYGAQERQLVLGYEIAASEHVATVNSLLAQAEQTYWSAVLARANVQLQKDTLAQRLEDLRVTEEKYANQLVPKLDVIRASAKVEESRSFLVEAEALYTDALSRLAALAGGEEAVPVRMELLVPDRTVSADFEAAWTARPDVRAGTLSVERAKVLRSLAAKGMSPTLDGSVGYVFLTDSAKSTPPEQEAIFSLTVGVPVSDGGATKANVREKEKTLEAANASLRSKRNEVTKELALAENEWKSAVAVELSKRQQVARSDEELKITQLMYKEGMGAQIDLLNAQVENRKVRTEHLNAIKDMYFALVSLRKAIGQYVAGYSNTYAGGK